jgi:hypothetical protein
MNPNPNPNPNTSRHIMYKYNMPVALYGHYARTCIRKLCYLLYADNTLRSFIAYHCICSFFTFKAVGSLTLVS